MTERLNVVGLLSGGKDSCYNLCHCAALGHNIVALATLAPPEGKDELDSYMYQTVGHDAIHLIAQAMDLPLYRTTIKGKALNQTSTYGDRLPNGKSSTASSSTLDHDETEDLFTLLKQVKQAHPEVNAVSVGAILSNYQRVRVEHVALRTGMELLPLSFLWQRDQAELLDEMCAADMQSILIKVAGAGLEREDLGKTLKQMRNKLHKLNRLYGAHICGEGGEYETSTLDCPLFKRKIILDKTIAVTHGEESSDGVFYMKIEGAHLEDKTEQVEVSASTITIPDRFDKYSVRSRPQERLESISTELSNKQPLKHIRQETFVTKNGPWCAISGIQGSAVEGNDIQTEIRSAFQSLEGTLRSQGFSFEHLAHLNVYLSNQRHFAALNMVYKTLFGVDPPSRACVAINLDGEQSNILIDAYAYGNRLAKSAQSIPRKALHVQGRSYWAAANIGPYSQAVEIGGRISIAGQIGLDPITLQLVQDPFDQTILALQHARRIFKAILEDHRVLKKQGWIEGSICWMNDVKQLPFARQLWHNQSQETSDDDDEGDAWEDSWLGSELNAKDIPTLFVTLAEDGLPRNASVEWQLSAQSGDQDTDEADDDDDDSEESSGLRLTQGADRFGTCSVEWTCISKNHSASQFGIAYLNNSDEQSKTDSTTIAALLQTHGASVRLFYTNDAVVDQLRESLGQLPVEPNAAITYIPVSGLFDRNASQIDAAIVWQTA
ncbi:adenine nucleotide alpha hydrolases-like protein [Meira miltonrushii]|uniref:Diphthine--ammonia ligase n=1 Tax=Meira miltonrushii TaxID=1280837 RepID=A0A316VI66_9BASI|nr:adenine nucleotide alpha hydrolases-like protein [Meira miltonrushii]PWN37236.1 adenine nucleotide alpha hydrolases-like protein [Meira miltonrushii]